MPPLTEQNLQGLPFIVTYADLVGYSFVRNPEDVAALQSRPAALNARSLGIVLKIETRTAFEALPGLLPAAMRSDVARVMIARGDLAVECGYERLAELQEEILCVAEAAHMPVIWATQVLERLAQTGMPTRAEISDAAMGERAECVMLSKGPHMVEAVRVLEASSGASGASTHSPSGPPPASSATVLQTTMWSQRMIATRSHKLLDQLKLWLAKGTGTPASACSRSTALITSAARGSSPANRSSRNRISGAKTSAAAGRTRW